jgi:membrane protease YdiL (CAAX protease family)
MRADESCAAGDLCVKKEPEQIASWVHLIGFFLIGAGVVVFGLWAQHAPSGGGGATTGQLASHGSAIPVYISAIFMDWALLYFCWVGVHRRGGSLWALSGGRWRSWKSVAADLGIALPFWGIWEGAAYGVHWLEYPRVQGAGAAKTVDSLLPQSLVEILLWIAVSATAGICEEMVFRGYLQRQFHALTKSIVAAVLGQGLVFGFFHFYQGWRNVVVISVLGVLYGALAAWRGNLRANIVVHAWTDFWEGWLKFVILR